MNIYKHMSKHSVNSTYTNLIYECTFQLCTLLFLWSMLSAIYYICVGLQYEYFSALFSIQQCVQFDWQTTYFDRDWYTNHIRAVDNELYEPERHAHRQTNPQMQVAATFSSSNTFSSKKQVFVDFNAWKAVPTYYSMSNESSIWSNLNTALLMSFVKWTLMTEIIIWFVQCSMQFLFYTTLILYICTLLFKFITPGLVQSFRCSILLHFSWIYLVCIACADLIINGALPVFAEFQIEVVDSELMYITI